MEISRNLLENILEELYELRGQINWWKDEIRCNYCYRYSLLLEEIEQVKKMLVKK